MNQLLSSEVTVTTAFLEPLTRWSVLLLVAWVLHGFLRRRHARSRVILWRIMLVLTVLQPVWSLVRAPVLVVDMPVAVVDSFRRMDSPEQGVLITPLGRPTAVISDHSSPEAIESKPTTDTSVMAEKSRSPWKLVGWIWAIGVILGMMRLVRWHWHLRRLRRSSVPAGQEIVLVAKDIAEQLGLRRQVEVRISKHIRSPLICGYWRHWLLIPESWFGELSGSETKAMVRHELAHVKGSDLRWTIGWRWVLTSVWFHPLTWGIAKAHQLACEQEADRVASEWRRSGNDYRGLLARLALRACRIPSGETELALNASSEVVQRLDHLRKNIGVWNRRHTFVASALVLALIGIAIGWRFSIPGGQIGSSQSYKEFEITVVAPDGKPVEGAVVRRDGLREHHNTASHYGWDPMRHGSSAEITTDSLGKAKIGYPVYVDTFEKLRTIQLSFSVEHPSYCRVRLTEYPVDRSIGPIRLYPGVKVEVSGYYGPKRELITELIPLVSAEEKVEWSTQGNGVWVSENHSAGGKLLQVMGRLPTGGIGYSDTISFTAEVGSVARHSLEMKPGIRLLGRVDDRVPRPVKNGRVLIAIRPPQLPAFDPNRLHSLQKTHGHFDFWRSHRAINEDGSFEFGSIPPGELDVIVHGDGFCSEPGDLLPAGTPAPRGFTVPQVFSLARPQTAIVVKTEKTATLKIAVTTGFGKPIPGANIYMSPNLLRIGGIFGTPRRSSEQPFYSPPELSPMPFKVRTSSDGIAIADNLPACTKWLDLEHAEYSTRIASGYHDRATRLEKPLEPGETRSVQIVVERKGRNHLGAR